MAVAPVDVVECAGRADIHREAGLDASDCVFAGGRSGADDRVSRYVHEIERLAKRRLRRRVYRIVPASHLLLLGIVSMVVVLVPEDFDEGGRDAGALSGLASVLRGLYQPFIESCLDVKVVREPNEPREGAVVLGTFVEEFVSGLCASASDGSGVSGVVVVRGGAGIGKTTGLLKAWVESGSGEFVHLPDLVGLFDRSRGDGDDRASAGGGGRGGGGGGAGGAAGSRVTRDDARARVPDRSVTDAAVGSGDAGAAGDTSTSDSGGDGDGGGGGDDRPSGRGAGPSGGSCAVTRGDGGRAGGAAGGGGGGDVSSRAVCVVYADSLDECAGVGREALLRSDGVVGVIRRHFRYSDDVNVVVVVGCRDEVCGAIGSDAARVIAGVDRVSDGWPVDFDDEGIDAVGRLHVERALFEHGYKPRGADECLAVDEAEYLARGLYRGKECGYCNV